jgi:hypothetical protein
MGLGGFQKETFTAKREIKLNPKKKKKKVK